MKTKLICIQRTAVLLLLSTFNYQLPTQAQGTAFTYQGRLTDGASPAGGIYDLRFTIYDLASGGSPVGPILTNTATAVSNGLFSVGLDFGNQFPGANRWLEIAARTNGGGAFTVLSPRQAITATPYAITASNLSGTLPAAQLSGPVASANLAGTCSGAVTLNNAANSFSGNGAGLTALNASQLTSGTVPAAALGNAWKINGNAGTTPGTHSLGTTDNQPLELKVNGDRALRLEPTAGAPNIIGGAADSQINPNSAGAGVLSGAGHTIFNASDYSVIAGGLENYVGILSSGAFIGGGRTNRIGNSSTNSAIAGGAFNQINRDHSVIGGGLRNTNRSSFAFIGGGMRNRADFDSDYSTIGGGNFNAIVDASVATIGGGSDNAIQSASYATIAGGSGNEIQTNAYNATISGGYANRIRPNATYATLSGGYGSLIDHGANYGTIGGGYANWIVTNAGAATIGGGFENTIGADAGYGFLGGGLQNVIRHDANSATIGGGSYNTIYANADFATIPGGYDNSATNYAFAAGRRAKANHTGSFVWGDSFSGDVSSSAANQFTVRASGGVRFFSNTALSSGVSLAAGGTSWGVISDRNVKKNFQPVNSHEVLEQLAALPLTRWNYEWEADGDVPHLGPMAQDFKAAFYPGRDDKTISTLEFDGVALAAIQGLNEKLEQQLEQKQTEIAELKQRLEKLEQLLAPKLAGGVK